MRDWAIDTTSLLKPKENRKVVSEIGYKKYLSKLEGKRMPENIKLETGTEVPGGGAIIDRGLVT
jgi:hypothetical protein